MRLSGKTALITGAARGLGRACALRFAEEGADLALFDLGGDIDEVPYPLGGADQLEHTAELCRKLGAAVVTATGDIRSQESVARAVEAATDRFGRIDVLVNNAGIVAPSGKDLHEVDEREWAVMLDVNLTGAWRMTKAVVPGMLPRRSGSIINVASTAGLVGYRRFAGYVASKHGLIGLTRAAALDYAPLKIRVNAICPGSVRDDPLVDGRMLVEIARALDVPVQEHEGTFAQGQPANELVEPDDIAAAALWLAGDDSRRVTGAVITVDGGYTVR
ncbi:NAD(P)-dependent dehydrogenase (short-subunit alcohol dehydrogenase family) [Thermocatellispora tengchongensis]|uniref:NAD(P)-dependent dehydrogenase (Short-subunit alcohol dehydrogenase family) n=1 Tax=Thermocatellispora tengchongensis TaxID=1073253 RepID=A0A840PED2_9ACTN|nr:mycofactocin-coupled SDR family oxidoreductase [Thermocatellispora tengchongensis]MBB5135507.1 NAD(P)-dependent dehydrogenase (short-subunit alcohol dehydrogenase family) [Thermocatellispora tengchongensis]